MHYLKISEIAERLRVHPATVRRLIDSGEIPAVYVGAQARVLADDLERYLVGNTSTKSVAETETATTL